MTSVHLGVNITNDELMPSQKHRLISSSVASLLHKYSVSVRTVERVKRKIAAYFLTEYCKQREKGVG